VWKRELIKRVDEILNTSEIEINNESKIIWKNNPIARLKKGNNYLNPDIDIIADEVVK
jgi:ATP-dependent RNA helicase SUPV3L1/SUV3